MSSVSKVAAIAPICFNFYVTVLKTIKLYTFLDKLECFYPNKCMQTSSSTNKSWSETILVQILLSPPLQMVLRKQATNLILNFYKIFIFQRECYI